jgi:hypothetical protein
MNPAFATMVSIPRHRLRHKDDSLPLSDWSHRDFDCGKAILFVNKIILFAVKGILLPTKTFCRRQNHFVANKDILLLTKTFCLQLK